MQFFTPGFKPNFLYNTAASSLHPLDFCFSSPHDYRRAQPKHPNMATDVASMPINGNYGSQQSFGTSETQPSSHNLNNPTGASMNGSTATNGPTASVDNNTSGAAQGSSSVPKDEVGWYFVEQYYTTLSRSPDKLHVSDLFICG